MLECQFLVFWLLQHESFVIMKLFQFSEFAGDRFPNRTSSEVGVGRFGKECTAPLGLAVHFFQGAFVFSSYLGKLYISLDHPYSAKKDAKTLNIKLRQNTHSCRQAQARSRAHTHTHTRTHACTHTNTQTHLVSKACEEEEQQLQCQLSQVLFPHGIDEPAADLPLSQQRHVSNKLATHSWNDRKVFW